MRLAPYFGKRGGADGRVRSHESPPAKGEYPQGEGVFPFGAEYESTTPPFGHPSLAGGESGLELPAAVNSCQQS